jgi:N-methylhydantoinase A
MATRIGVDIGGTFTDLVYFDDVTGEVREAKVPTTPAAPEEGVVAAVREAVPREVIERAAYFLHGTTVGLNALLERRGAIVGLLATKGFRDILEVRRGDRAEMYNLFWQPPEPLVPRRLRLPITERTLATGQVHIALEPDDVRRAAAVFASEGVTSVAVAFLNAYANPHHELEAERVLREAGFSGEISLSHRVSGEYREYERTSTTVIDAFVRGRMSGYLGRLEQRLKEIGFGGTLLITRSGGGSMTFAEAEERPFETIMSGPVAGAEGAGELTRRHRLGDLITADVGGTSFDTSLITDGRATVMYEGSVDGMPVQTPWVDVRSIGAGGGSIAFVDVGGLLQVGPRSAGADPGPASYGKGGSEPTTTDAAAVLGMLGKGELASGITLDVAAARRALEPVARALGFTVEATAKGILTIAAANMANAMREITVEQGVDPRGLTLLPFGGAGPMMATLLANELGLGRIVVPPFAGNFSAWGLLGADMTQSAARTKIVTLDEEALPELNRILTELFQSLAVRRQHHDDDTTVREASLDMRYRGQEHWLSVPVRLDGARIAADVDEVLSDFGVEYMRTFGSIMDEVVEVVSTRATLRTPLPRREESHPVPDAPIDARSKGAETLDAYSFTRDAVIAFGTVRRDDLGPRPVIGPMIVTEATATTYVDVGFDARVDSNGCMVITRTEVLP